MGTGQLNHRIRLWIRELMRDENAWFKKIVPAGIRHLISGPLADKVVRNEHMASPFVPGIFPKGLNLYGLFRSEIGLSQGAKLYARALEEGGIPHTLLNLDFIAELPQNDRSYDDRLTVQNRYAINVVHINPPEWEYALALFPQKQFDGHYNIGVFLWELEEIPDDWVPMFRHVDEIWAPSRFIAEAVRRKADKPVTVIPYGMDTPYDEALTRADFGLEEGDFLVLMMFDSNSYASRKNPGGAIDAFREAFGERPEGAKLVIKISHPTPEDIAFVEEHMGGTDGYVLITERMDKRRLNSLIRLCDVFLSLHRAEGFGLVMAEAMMLGTPCVATSWSANTEFMPPEAACMVDYRLVPVNGAYQSDDGTMRWAEADTNQAAEYLKRLREDPEYYREKAEKGLQTVRDKLSMRACAETIRSRMEAILNQAEQGEQGKP